MKTHRPVRVLIVDDQPDIVRLWSTLLRAEGYEVIGCTDPGDALALVAERDVEVILCDHAMPGISGLELLAMASRLHPDVARVMVTAYTTPDVVLRAVNDGHVQRFLTKPCSATALRQTLRAVAGEVRAGRTHALGRSVEDDGEVDADPQAATSSSHPSAPTSAEQVAARMRMRGAVVPC